MSFSKRERKLVIVTLTVALVGVVFAYVYRPLADARAHAIEVLPERTRAVEQARSQGVRKARLERDLARLKQDMGNPAANLVPFAGRLEAQKKLTEVFQNMGLDKPYTIRPGAVTSREAFDTIEYAIEGKMDWEKFVSNLNDFEWHEHYLNVHTLKLTREGKVQVSMRVTLYLAKEGMEPPSAAEEAAVEAAADGGTQG